jgi:hypothetical protein
MTDSRLAGIIDGYLEPRFAGDRPDVYTPSRCPVCSSQDFLADSEWAEDIENRRTFAEFSFDCHTCYFTAENWDGTSIHLAAQAATYREEGAYDES